MWKWLIIPIFFILGCKKYDLNKIEDFSVQTIKEGIRINALKFFNDSVGFLAGGIRDQSGFLFKTEDGGNSWAKVFELSNSSIYEINGNDQDLLLAGGDFLRLYKSQNFGKDWSPIYFYDSVPIHEMHRPPITDIEFTPSSNIYFSGGKEYDKGVLYYSNNLGKDWTFRFHYHEITDIDIINHKLSYSGYGITGTYNVELIGNNIHNLNGDFFTGIKHITEDKLIATGNSGDIYASSDGGENWTVNLKSSGIKEHGINKLEIFEDNFLALVGNNGYFAYSDDNGQTWNEYYLNIKDHLFSLEKVQNRFVIGGNKGLIYTVKID